MKARNTERSKMARRPASAPQVAQSNLFKYQKISNANRLNSAAFDPEHAPPTCGSALPHGPEAIRDHVRHYFACIEIAERGNYLNPDHEVWKYEHNIEAKSLRSLPEYAAAGEDDIQHEARRRVGGKISGVDMAINAQCKRIQTLRKALAKAPDPGATAAQGGPDHDASSQSGHLVRCVEESHEKWKNSEEFNEGIEKVRRWRNRQATNPTNEPVDGSADEADYALELDINGYLIQYTRKTEERRGTVTPSNNANDNMNVIVATANDATNAGNDDAQASLVKEMSEISLSQVRDDSQINKISAGSKTSTWSHSPIERPNRLKPVDEGATHFQFKGQFPDQRTPVHFLLQNPADPAQPAAKPSILSRARCMANDPTRVRYFHIPSNNMEVCLLPNTNVKL